MSIWKADFQTFMHLHLIQAVVLMDKRLKTVHRRWTTYLLTLDMRINYSAINQEYQTTGNYCRSTSMTELYCWDELSNFGRWTLSLNDLIQNYEPKLFQELYQNQKYFMKNYICQTSRCCSVIRHGYNTLELRVETHLVEVSASRAYTRESTRKSLLQAIMWLIMWHSVV